MPESPRQQDAAALPIENNGLEVPKERLVAPGTEGEHNSGSAQEGAAPEVTTGRRQLFVAAGAAALGAVGASLLEGSPAGASTGNMMYGAVNNAGATTTELDSTASPTPTLLVTNSNTGAAAITAEVTTTGAGGAAISASSSANIGSAITGFLSNNSNESASVIGQTGGTGIGVWGLIANTGNTDTAVLGLTNGTGPGVTGQITNAASAASAVLGTTAGTGPGVKGQITNAANTGAAVLGTTNGTGPGVQGSAAGVGAAVLGANTGSGPGLSGQSTSGYGVSAQGGRAPMLLTPADTAGPPSGTHAAGEIYVDTNGVFYRCVAAGVPGTWVPMYSVVPLLAPVRVLSTPAGSGRTGGLTGPFDPDGSTHTTAVLTGGSTGIPDIAVGVVANLAISGNGATLNGNGFLTLFPAGTVNPNTASINCGGDAFATSNGVTVAFGTGADAGKLSFSWQGGGGPRPCQVFLDVTAYIL